MEGQLYVLTQKKEKLEYLKKVCKFVTDKVLKRDLKDAHIPRHPNHTKYLWYWIKRIGNFYSNRTNIAHFRPLHMCKEKLIIYSY